MAGFEKEYDFKGQEGAIGVEIEIGGLGDFTPFAGRSGKAPPGLYPVQWPPHGIMVKKASAQAKGTHNLVSTLAVAGPHHAGTPIIRNAAAPKKSDVDDAGYRELRSMFWSIQSADPARLEAAKKAKAIKLNLKTHFGGKVGYVELRNSDDPEYDNSEIARWVTKAEYEANPGPFDKAGAGTNGAKASAKQRKEPDALEEGKGESKEEGGDEDVFA